MDNPAWSGDKDSIKGDKYDDLQAARFICPVVGLEMNGRHRSVLRDRKGGTEQGKLAGKWKSCAHSGLGGEELSVFELSRLKFQSSRDFWAFFCVQEGR